MITIEHNENIYLWFGVKNEKCWYFTNNRKVNMGVNRTNDLPVRQLERCVLSLLPKTVSGFMIQIVWFNLSLVRTYLNKTLYVVIDSKDRHGQNYHHTGWWCWKLVNERELLKQLNVLLNVSSCNNNTYYYNKKTYWSIKIHFWYYTGMFFFWIFCYGVLHQLCYGHTLLTCRSNSN